MEQVYLAILKTFAENKKVFTDRHLPVIRTIDINIGQPDDPENFEVFCPAIFISWDIKPGIAGEPDNLTLDFHILQEPKGHTESFSNAFRSPSGVEGIGAEVSIEYMRLIKACKYLLNSLRVTGTPSEVERSPSGVEGTTPLKYAGERQAATPYFRYHILTYTCSIDAYTDSIHRPQMTTGTVEAIRITNANQKPTTDTPSITIETYT
ncbi:hypothetical protein [Acetobacteroides hydrogenigenes]|uniref:Gp37 protein n=1 Tax=Acetobacteroides hydrogenigenes TaxID=979970 RepID=A0A4R2E9V2_9BACT|nr:hypothetical protein [Acetobacteroides hydrogenigenes]TCN63696.1 hypothetical protein CLV25_11546 [Acetobacteroides hydrogenigenes]